MVLFNPTDCPYYLISRVYLLVTSALKKGFADEGVEIVKPAYLGVLLSLWREDGLKLGQLARRAGLEPSTMTGLLDRMERDGLAYRAADAKDRRSQVAFLTDTGRKIRDPVMRVVDKMLSHTFSDIPEKEFEGIKKTLKQVLVNAKKGIQ